MRSYLILVITLFALFSVPIIAEDATITVSHSEEDERAVGVNLGTGQRTGVAFDRNIFVQTIEVRSQLARCQGWWLVAQGKVKVNGKVAKLGDQADSEKDKITLDNKPLLLQKKVYIMLNKPKGFVTTVSEQFGMKTVMELVKIPQRIFPVGRLDKDTDGLLLLTN